MGCAVFGAPIFLWGLSSVLPFRRETHQNCMRSEWLTDRMDMKRELTHKVLITEKITSGKQQTMIIVSKRLSHFVHSVFYWLLYRIESIDVKKGVDVVHLVWKKRFFESAFLLCAPSLLNLCVHVLSSDGQSSIKRNFRNMKLFHWLIFHTRVRQDHKCKMRAKSCFILYFDFIFWSQKMKHVWRDMCFYVFWEWLLMKKWPL